jgi:hypothetical protein
VGDKSYSPNFACLLRTRRERPHGRRTNNSFDEISPPHGHPRLKTGNRTGKSRRTGRATNVRFGS